MAKRRRQNGAGLSQYDSMDTKALQELLREDSKRDTIREGELEVLLYIMDILARRNRWLRKSTELAWQEFQQRWLHHIRPPSVILSPWLRRDEPAAWGVCPLRKTETQSKKRYRPSGLYLFGYTCWAAFSSSSFSSWV